MGWTLSTNIKGATGTTGSTGSAGTNGTNGQGVPTGGTTGQYLTKIDGTNYNTQWSTLDTSLLQPLASYGPADHGLLAWNYDPIFQTGSTALTSGTMTTAKIRIASQMTVGKIVLHVNTAGSTLTSGQSFAALYNDAGTVKIGQTADQSAAWASTGVKSMALTGGPFVLSAGIYAISWWSVGTTPPQFNRCNTQTSGNNINLSGSSFLAGRFGSGPTSLTTTAPAVPLGAYTGLSTVAYWCALAA